MAQSLPALRGKFGSTEFYLVTMKASEFVRTVIVPKEMEGWENLSVEEKFQREINYKRVKEKMAPYLIGCHVHDVYWPDRDHRVPLTGELDFVKLLRHVDPRLPLVWELSPTRQASEIKESLRVWKTKFPETLSS